MEMKPVKSSNIQEIGHDGETLAVRFRNGAVYHYPGVSVDRHQEIVGAGSIGKAIRALGPGKLVK